MSEDGQSVAENGQGTCHWCLRRRALGGRRRAEATCTCVFLQGRPGRGGHLHTRVPTGTASL